MLLFLIVQLKTEDMLIQKIKPTYIMHEPEIESIEI